MIVIAILIIILLYGGINYWIGIRAWQGLFRYFPHAIKYRPLYWSIYILIVFSYIIGRFIQDYLSANINRFIAYLGAYWLATMFYAVLFLFLFEVIKRVNQFVQVIPAKIVRQPIFQMAFSILFIVSVSGILVYGTWNAQNPRIQHYDLQMDKSASNLKTLHVVMVSDIHLGTMNQNKLLNGLITRVKALEPDMIVLLGIPLMKMLKSLSSRRWPFLYSL